MTHCNEQYIIIIKGLIIMTKWSWEDVWDFKNPDYALARVFYITSIGIIIFGGLFLILVR